jgi:hypothetical protein
MTKDSNPRPQGTPKPTGEFGFQPIEKRGHQPIQFRPRVTVSDGYQPTTSQGGNAPATPPSPPSQGSSGKK